MVAPSAVFVISFLVRASTSEVIHLGLLMPLAEHGSIGKTISGAMHLAISAVNEMPSLSSVRDANYTFNFTFGETDCSAGKGMLSLVTLYNRYQVDAFIGGYCDSVCAPGGLVATELQVPMIGYGCSSSEMSDKTVYPMFARTVAPITRASRFVIRILKKFKWNRVTILGGEQHIWHLTTSSFKNDLEANGIKVINTYQVGLTASESSLTPEEALRRARTDTRGISESIDALKKRVNLVHPTDVFLLTTYPTLVDSIMKAASYLGLHNGQYVFLSLESDFGRTSGFMENMAESHSNHGKRKRRAAVRVERSMMSHNMSAMNNSHMVTSHSSNPQQHLIGLLDIAISEPLDDPSYVQFTHQVHMSSMKAPFYSHLDNTTKVDIAAAFLYDAVLLYAIALNKTLSLGGNLSHIVHNLYPMEFQGIDGRVVIDSQGDRYPNYALRNFNNSGYVMVAHYSQINDDVMMMDDKQIVWPGGGNEVPLGRPDCGWNNEFCITEKPELMSRILGGVCGSIALLTIICVAVICRRTKLKEAQLSSLAWKINFDEIKLAERFKSVYSNLGTSSSLSSRLASMSQSCNTKFVDHTYCKPAIYRGTLVCLKPLNKDHVALTKEILRELNQARALNHPNVNQFIGACVDINHVSILESYCQKGSLQDVLENDSVKLDNLFKVAFSLDIAQGMEYLHRSEVGIHGRLSSARILVDNRWQCKITGYGLSTFKRVEKSNVEESTSHQKQLWTSPEGLQDPGKVSTQKSDVYSYGIILQEIILQSVPYDYNNKESKEIIEKIISGENPPFRPFVPPEACPQYFHDLMTSCWEESPENRPSFRSVVTVLKTSNKGGNIMDNMVHMMEKYASRLEEIVEDRTKQLVQEQAKTENLLSMMLPKIVADDLKAGRTVKPEHFESVTIYFSDIVGFTSLSSRSTPMQVVEFLNDLYTCFDYIIGEYDVYKVETIGDAYMVVSGLPQRNGDKHVGEIAGMSLELLSAVRSLPIRHLPEEKLKLRIGLHTGSCVAGVVGLTMPRYCLFGDTVNYASRMESNGLPLKIHISPECNDALMLWGGFCTVERGDVELKGKGTVRTYFLLGKNDEETMK